MTGSGKGAKPWGVSARAGERSALPPAHELSARPPGTCPAARGEGSRRRGHARTPTCKCAQNKEHKSTEATRLVRKVSSATDALQGRAQGAGRDRVACPSASLHVSSCSARHAESPSPSLLPPSRPKTPERRCLRDPAPRQLPGRGREPRPNLPHAPTWYGLRIIHDDHSARPHLPMEPIADSACGRERGHAAATRRGHDGGSCAHSRGQDLQPVHHGPLVDGAHDGAVVPLPRLAQRPAQKRCGAAKPCHRRAVPLPWESAPDVAEHAQRDAPVRVRPHGGRPPVVVAGDDAPGPHLWPPRHQVGPHLRAMGWLGARRLGARLTTATSDRWPHTGSTRRARAHTRATLTPQKSCLASTYLRAHARRGAQGARDTFVRVACSGRQAQRQWGHSHKVDHAWDGRHCLREWAKANTSCEPQQP